MKTLLIFTAILTILLFQPSCRENATGPAVPDTTSRSFVWRVDTLWTPRAGQITMWDIWGSSENDVWAVGHSDDPKARIWHWDGETCKV